MDLNLVKLNIALLKDDLQPAVQLLSGRGVVFEEELKRVACRKTGSSCPACSCNESCPVSAVISKELSSNPDLVRWHQKPGLPFVFEMIDFGSDDPRLGLTLLGPAITHMPLLLKTVDHILGRQAVRRITVLDYQGHNVVLNGAETAVCDNIPVLSTSELLALSASCFGLIERVYIDVLSPLRLIRDGRQLNHFDPVFFIRTILRRLSSLFAYYGSGVEHEQIRILSELASTVRLVRYVKKNVTDKARTRGMSGCYELVGPFHELGPYLTLGGLLHVGKGAAYGMGAFNVTPIS